MDDVVRMMNHLRLNKSTIQVNYHQRTFPRSSLPRSAHTATSCSACTHLLLPQGAFTLLIESAQRRGRGRVSAAQNGWPRRMNFLHLIIAFWRPPPHTRPAQLGNAHARTQHRRRRLPQCINEDEPSDNIAETAACNVDLERK